MKICGLTRLQDVALAVELGAWAVGFVFAPSPRRVTGDGAPARLAAQRRRRASAARQACGGVCRRRDGPAGLPGPITGRSVACSATSSAEAIADMVGRGRARRGAVARVPARMRPRCERCLAGGRLPVLVMRAIPVPAGRGGCGRPAGGSRRRPGGGGPDPVRHQSRGPLGRHGDDLPLGAGPRGGRRFALSGGGRHRAPQRRGKRSRRRVRGAWTCRAGWSARPASKTSSAAARPFAAVAAA